MVIAKTKPAKKETISNGQDTVSSLLISDK
jgi:hypothetical protein